MKAKSTTAIIYSQGLNKSLERNIAKLQGWVSEILVMYFGEPSSFVDKIRSLDGVRVHRTLWRGSLGELRNEAKSISRGEFHIHFYENENVADCSLWPKVHDCISKMDADQVARIAIKPEQSNYWIWQSRVFHRSYTFSGEWHLNPESHDLSARKDVAFCVNSNERIKLFWQAIDPIDALSLDSKNPWALYDYAEKNIRIGQVSVAEAALSSVCRTTVECDLDLNHAAMIALIECQLNRDAGLTVEPALDITADRTRHSSAYCHMMGDLYASRYALSDDNDEYDLSMEFYLRSLSSFHTDKLSRHIVGSGSLLTKHKIQRLFDMSRGFA